MDWWGNDEKNEECMLRLKSVDAHFHQSILGRNVLVNMCLCVYLSDCLFVGPCMFVYLSICLPICLLICLPICLSAC